MALPEGGEAKTIYFEADINQKVLAQLSKVSRPRTVLYYSFGVIALATIGSLSDVPIGAPLVALCVLATGSFLLEHMDLSPVERLILVPAVGISLLAASSLLIPLLSGLGLLAAPIHQPLVVATAVSLPTIAAIMYWASQPNPTVPTVDISSRLLIPSLPVLLGGGGALIQQQYGLVSQNFVVMGLLVVCGPLLVYWAQTDFETAVALFGLATGVLLSHTLVTGYAVGIDVQMSLNTIDYVTDVGSWSVQDVFFKRGASAVGLSELVGYIGSERAHTGLPVIVGIPILFETVGNVAPDAVFDIVYVAVFGLTPAAVFRIGRQRLSRKEAFAAGVLVIAYYRFFHTSPAKQHMAQFFMAALLVGWVANIRSSHRNAIAAIVAIGIVFSHYTVTFLFLGFIILTYVLKKWYAEPDSLSAVSALFVSYFYAVVIIWYGIFTGGKKPLAALSAILASIESVLTSGSAQSRTGASVAAQQTVIVDQINLGLHGMLFGAIFLGVLVLLFHGVTTREPMFSVDIDPLALCFFSILGLSMVVSGYLGIDRALDISLIVLAPVAVLGVRYTLDSVGSRLSMPGLPSHTHKIAIVFVMLFFLFSSGLAYEAAGDPASSAINLHENPNSVVYTDEEYRAAQWVVDNRNNSTIYTGTFGSTAFHRVSGASLPYLQHYKNFSGQVEIPWNESGYIFVRKAAIVPQTSEPVPRYELGSEEYQYLRERSVPAYENSAVIILRIPAGNTERVSNTSRARVTPTDGATSTEPS
ncbi:DUF2206 domain-containing protein [Haloarcula salinisoli]|uniref:DUF2206 domain-containing protein n=1 Tax=Haloarcula salinisoli TaxID=2487746 RepID=A0A8J7Y9V6_9EURY|nr:DUF2206 domain-containing protein [Halomicroarcula salinisoli]MBX0286466.1 DUF2206 domain-containing protein [Halomicroarcula salinisoli]MBX0302045.1 DUF2206 domain-containing protein [Halomicroarcula salinisoli]